MAGFFGLFDYSKPGKGIDPDAPKKNAFFRFFELFFRKISKLILLNLIYFVIAFPIISYLYMLFYSMVSQLGDVEITEIATLMLQLIGSFVGGVSPLLQIIALCVSIILIGPATAGMTYMIRNFVREEHAWMSDFFDRAKANFKQGLMFGLLDVLVFAVLSFNLNFASEAMAATGAGDTALFFLQAAQVFSVLFGVLYLFMHNYIYVLIVTFELKFREILKNSFIFAIIGMWRNIFVGVLSLALAVCVFFLNEYVEVFALPLIAISLWFFISVFACYPLVKKYLIDPQLTKEEEDETPQITDGE